MKPTIRLVILLLGFAVVFTSLDANAGVRRLGPPDHFSAAEKEQYWLGAVGIIAGKLCGYHSDGQKLLKLAKKYKASKYAIARWGNLRYMGSCTEIKNEWVPYYLRKFEKLAEAENQIIEWHDRIVCQYAVDHYSSDPKWAGTPSSANAESEALRRGFTPADCVTIYALTARQLDSLPADSIEKLISIDTLLRDELITEQEAEEKRQAILGDL